MPCYPRQIGGEHHDVANYAPPEAARPLIGGGGLRQAAKSSQPRPPRAGGHPIPDTGTTIRVPAPIPGLTRRRLGTRDNLSHLTLSARFDPALDHFHFLLTPEVGRPNLHRIFLSQAHLNRVSASESDQLFLEGPLPWRRCGPVTMATLNGTKRWHQRGCRGWAEL
ncbi:hypothetical protein Bbelb_390840 [Branchiostoma belcheri]|nr:hypothetical protein Bbelb_390840 [Branchiostoma belcheri]